METTGINPFLAFEALLQGEAQFPLIRHLGCGNAETCEW
jgi:hypothetical protein